eukprot:gene27196-biopygen7256
MGQVYGICKEGVAVIARSHRSTNRSNIRQPRAPSINIGKMLRPLEAGRPTK